MAEPALVYCPHMDMDIYDGTCAMCTPPPPEKVTGTPLVTMSAQFETGCDACDKRIHPGQDIALVDGVWIHTDHLESETTT